MNRQLVSHYGWIIIITMVIAVMIAFATPLGEYVGVALVGTTNGLTNVSDKALSDENMSNEEQGWKDTIGELRSEFETHEGTIPEGGVYITGGESDSYKTHHDIKAGSGTIIPVGQKFPTPKTGDVYKYGSFLYRYNCGISGYDWVINESMNGWNVTALSVKEEYEPPLESIGGKNVVSAIHMFCNNGKMKTSPKLPDTIENMMCAFEQCFKLTTITNIPANATNISSMCDGCRALETVPELPNKVSKMTATFGYCTALTSAPKIPNTVTNMQSTFKNCTALQTPPPVIPEKVTNMKETFWNCPQLTGTIEVKANPAYIQDCFLHTTQPITLTGTSPQLNALKNSGNDNPNITVVSP